MVNGGHILKTESGTPVRTRKTFTQKLDTQGVAGYVFILPFIIGFLSFLLVPMIMSLVYSFTEYDILKEPTFIGAANYIDMFTNNAKFWDVLQVTLYYVVFSVPLRLAMALLVAMLLVKSTKLSGFYRAVFYLPSIIGSSVAVALLWKRMFASDGVVNGVIKLFGGQGNTAWLGRGDTAIWTLIILAIWQFGSSMLIFLSGLKQIPVSLYEAATVDGANGPQKFWSITLPMLTPTIFFNLVNQLINGFMAFTQSYIITGGAPRDKTLFYTVYMYKQCFTYNKLGYGCAMAWFMVILVGLITLVLFKTQHLWVHYEAEE
jgi:multiple sugar transport system permease protein